MADFITELCRTNRTDLFPVWENGTISPCFNQLILNSLCHSVLAVSSACYLSAPRCDRVSSTSCRWGSRIAVALLMMLLFVADMVVVILLDPGAKFLDILADGCAIVAWFMHFTSLIKLSKSVYAAYSDPLALLALAIMPAVTLTITLVSYSTTEYTSHPLSLTRLILVSIQLFLLVLYLLTVVVPSSCKDIDALSINDSNRTPLFTFEDSDAAPEREGGSWISHIFYLWLNPLMKRGKQKKLERPSDVQLLPPHLRTRVIFHRFDQCWRSLYEDERIRAPPSEGTSNGTWGKSDSQDPLCEEGEEQRRSELRLFQVLHKAFGLRFYMLGLLKLIGNLLSFAGPLLLSSLVNFMESSQAPISEGLWCSLGLFATTVVSAIMRNVFTFEVSKVSLSARAAVISAIYRKSLRVSSTTLSRFTLGEVVNFMSTDTDRLINFFNSFHDMWNLPIQFAITLYLFYLQVGVAFLGGLAFALLLVPLNKVIATCIMKNNKHMLGHKDNRVKLMTEILFGIRVIKFYTWEPHFVEKIANCRTKELSHLKKIKYLDAVCVYTWAALPVVISILTFVTYVLLGNELTAPKVFTTLALVGMLILPLNNFPWILNSTIEAKVSLDRIQRFLSLSDQNLDMYYSRVAPDAHEIVVQMKAGSFSWKGDSSVVHEFKDNPADDSQFLHHVNVSIKKGSFVAVVGKVGCGKSSLLAAITGELQRCGGAIYIQGRENGFALAAQEPWIQHGSIRDNILFGQEYNSRLYQAATEACALTDDLCIFPDGDRTEVGENGVTLSGGQKARIALARAVYMDKDIYLLDDPLAAVDADVAQHILEKCILGVLRHKTRIICTHRIEFLDKADIVILMDNGTVTHVGTPSEILPMVEAVPKTRHQDYNRKITGEEDEEEEEQMDKVCQQQAPAHSVIGEEQKQSGVVTWKVYRSYWFAVGGCMAFSVLFFLLLMQASKNVSDWWLANWISNLKSDTNATQSRSLYFTTTSNRLSQAMLFPVIQSETTDSNASNQLQFYLTVYVSLAAANSVLTVIRAFLFAYGAICAATVIHNRLLDRLLKATVSFFDCTPLGRIINRFSSDLYSVDDTLPFTLNIMLANIFGLLGMLVMMSYSLPWILLLLVPLGILYYRIQHFYRYTSRELKRLYSITLSPIYTHFSETLTGLCTIRASTTAFRFENENESRLEKNQHCLFASNAAMQWLDIRLQMIGVLVVTGLSVIAIIQHQTKSVDSGLVGLSMSYALSITGLLSGLIFSFTQTETQMISVERTEEYSTEIPVEPQAGRLQVASSWPDKGHIEFEKAVLVYRPGLPNALDEMNVVIRSGEKVGVVGRTGSGKSTMFLALFRMMELSGGRILVDGVDIALVDLAQLRSKMAIIPQDPFLFSGTVRENLDPCGRHCDWQLLDVLEQCHLLHAVSRMGGLDTEVGEKGKCLSLGQRQLLCLARALLTEAKVLCIDEATASVDQKTDKLLQKTIREKFKERTVLTIAHRMNTIMDSDKVLVLHAGKAVEFDTPAALSQREDSIFHRLIAANPQ